MKRRTIITILVILLLSISMGYAALSTTLSINGSSRINNATWNVFWSNVQVKSGSVSASTPTIDSSKTTVTYDVTLNNPGDFYEFTVDANNTGSIDAMIDTVTSKLNGSVITTLPSYLDYYVSYDNRARIYPKQYLKSNTTEKIRIRVEFRKDITASDLPTSPQTLSFSFSINYVQSDETAQARAVYLTQSGMAEDPIVTHNTEPNEMCLIVEYGNGTEQGKVIKTRLNNNVPYMYFISGNTPEIKARNIRELKEKCPPENFEQGTSEIHCSMLHYTAYIYENGTVLIYGNVYLRMRPDGTYEYYGNEF